MADRKERIEVEWTDPDYGDEVRVVLDYRLDVGQQVRNSTLIGTLMNLVRDLKGAPGITIRPGYSYALDGEELFEEAALVEETGKGLATKINVIKVEDSFIVGDDDIDDSPLV